MGGNDVGHQLRGALAIRPHGHRRLAHGRVLTQVHLDLGQLDAESAKLDLVVPAPGELHLAIGQVAAEVPGAIEAIVGASREGTGHEALGRQGGLAQVAARQMGAPHEDLAQLADPRQLARGPEDQELDVRHAPSRGITSFRIAASSRVTATYPRARCVSVEPSRFTTSTAGPRRRR